MKSLYEGILSDIEITINNSDTTVKIYSIFDKVINSNADNFEKNLDECVKTLKTAGKKLNIKRAKSAWYNLSKNWILIEKRTRSLYPYTYVSIIFIKHTDNPEEWAGVTLASNTKIKESKLFKISSKYSSHRGAFSKNTSLYEYAQYEIYQLPDKFEHGLELIIDKINENF